MNSDKINKQNTDGVSLHVKAFDLPGSHFLSDEVHAHQKAQSESDKTYTEGLAKACTSLTDGVDAEALALTKQCQTAYFYANNPAYLAQKARYKINVETTTRGGVEVEIFTPQAGVSPINNNKVLISLHGGAFKHGSKTTSHLSAIPIAALGKIQVISVEYRLAPDHTFPAASEDVLAVYKALLETYPPENIGLYGSSAGGTLAAQSIALFLAKKLPLPAAIGMFAGAANQWAGDSDQLNSHLYGGTPGTLAKMDYYKDMRPHDPLAYPGDSLDVMKQFPPSLLISSSRDIAMSNVIVTHRQLIQLGISADLHIWEGLGHSFYYDAELPQSREAYAVIVAFFERHLASASAP